MRYVDESMSTLCRLGAMAAVVSLVGCAAVTDPLKSIGSAMQRAVSPSASASAAPVTITSTATVTATMAPAAAPEPEAPVAASTQTAFDNATRALRAGRTEEAERAFRALAQSNPQLGGPHANLGVIYRQANKLPEATTELELAVKLSPKQPIFLNQLGVTYRQAGQFAKAREAYEKAIALDAGYSAPYLNLGILNDMYLGDGPRALELYDRYLALQPGGDATVTKWIAELKNRKPAPITVGMLKEKT
jgi:Flp pilus assembly protein TadD